MAFDYRGLGRSSYQKNVDLPVTKQMLIYRTMQTVTKQLFYHHNRRRPNLSRAYARPPRVPRRSLERKEDPRPGYMETNNVFQKRKEKSRIGKAYSTARPILQRAFAYTLV